MKFSPRTLFPIVVIAIFSLATVGVVVKSAVAQEGHNHGESHAQEGHAHEHNHEGHAHDHAATEEEEEKIKGDHYTLDVCPVSGEKLDSRSGVVVHIHEDREIRFCCPGCLRRFENDPDEYLAKVDKLMIEHQKPHYPLDTCLVAGMPLGSMGDPVDLIHYNRLVRFCCAGCLGKFHENWEEYFEKLDEAVIEKQRDAYPLDTCVVMTGEGLTDHGEPIEMVQGNRLIRLCCEGCELDVRENPAKYLAMIDAALEAEKDSEEKEAPTTRPAEGHVHQ